MSSIEASPEFNQRCLEIVQQWETGVLEFAAAAQQLRQLGQQPELRGGPPEQARIESAIGYMEAYRGNQNSAIRHYEKARALYWEVGNQRRIAICDMNIGESYRYKGDFSRARQSYEKAHQIFLDTQDGENQAYVLNNMGQMYLAMGQVEQAYDHLIASQQLAGDIASDDERFPLLCELHYGLTQLYLRVHQVEMAWHEARYAHRLAGQHPKPLELGFGNRAIAEVLSELTEPLDADFDPDPDPYFQAANDAFREIKAEGEIARTMFVQAKSLLKRGRRMTAARKLQLAMVIFTRLGMVDDAAKAAEIQLEVLGE